MVKENKSVNEKSTREISEEFLYTLKKYTVVFLASSLIIGMFAGFVVLYS